MTISATNKSTPRWPAQRRPRSRPASPVVAPLRSWIRTASSTTGPVPISSVRRSSDAAGSGSRRSYSYRDLLELKVVRVLLDAGIKLELVEVFRYVREQLGEDISSSNIVINGQRSVLVRNGEELVDVLRAGQGVLNILPLAGVKQELDAKIIEFGDRPGSISPQAQAPGGSAAVVNR